MSTNLYVIPGSHACRSAMLMLDHKSIPYRVIALPSIAHPLLVRVRGFPGSPQPIRRINSRTPLDLSILDRLGTVPALEIGGEKVQTNHEIARHLDRVQRDPPLLPADPDARRDTEAAELWGDQTLQMAARRAALAAASNGLGGLRMRGARGRLGPLLTRSDLPRALVARLASRTFRAGGDRVAGIMEAIPPLLDRVDLWVTDGVLNGEHLTVADYMIAPSLALLTYDERLAAEIAVRPSGRLVDRLLPEPAAG